MHKDNYYMTLWWMREDLGLSGVELQVYAIIWGFSQDGESWFSGSLSYLEKWTGCKSKHTVIKALQGLMDKGLLQKETKIVNRVASVRYMAFREPKLTETVSSEGSAEIALVQNLHGGSAKNAPGVVQKLHQGSAEIAPNNINNNTTDNTKDIKHRYGQYKNVLLSDKDLEKLKTEFPDNWESWIETLSSGIEANGYKYKNHLAAIRNWAKRDAQRKPQRTQNRFNNFDQRNYDFDSLEAQLLQN